MSNTYTRTFNPPSSANSLASSPRWGSSNDISLLLDDSSQYTRGLVFGGSLMAAVFLLIAITLLVLTCCRRKGIVAGNRIPQDSSPLPRAVFCGSGMLFILCAILLVTQGLTNLQDSVVIFSRSARDIEILAQEAENLIDIVRTEIQESAVNIRLALSQELDGNTFCPADPTLENNAALTELRDGADAALQLLRDVDQIEEQVSAVAEGVAEAKEAANTVEQEASNIEITAWQALLVLIPLTLVPCLLVAASILAHFGADVPLEGVLHWVFLPLFIILVVLCSVAACIFLPLAIMNADLCLPPPLNVDPYAAGVPDTTVFRILDREGYVSGDDIIRKVANYYVGQCPADVPDPFEEWSGLLPTLREGQTSLNELSGTLNNEGSIAELTLYCGREYDSLQGLLGDMQTLVEVVVDSLQRALNAVSCDVWVPIYHRAVYDGACGTSLNAIVWMWSASLILASTGWLMLFLRSSYQPTAIQAHPKDSRY